MDKKRKKELKKKYIIQSLEKEAASDDQMLADVASWELGKTPEDLTLDQIRDMSDSQLEYQIVDRISHAIEKATKGRYGETEARALAKLPKEQQFLYLSSHLEGELFNGGFEQYFLNSAGEFIFETLEGYRYLNHQKMIELIEKSIGVFIQMRSSGEEFWLGTQKPKFTIKSSKSEAYYIEKCQNATFEALDDEYYSIQKELCTLKIEFIRKHAESLVVTGKE
jgi:hypothetical protein